MFSHCKRHCTLSPKFASELSHVIKKKKNTIRPQVMSVNQSRLHTASETFLRQKKKKFDFQPAF